MDSVLSGYSQNYSGTQIGQGQGYTGNVGTTGSAASGSAQGVDVTQLQPGDTFQGEIVSVNGEDVQIQLANGQYMAAKLERDVQLALGQVMNLQVQSNKDNRVVLKPVYDGKMQMLRVGEAALRAAHMAVNDRTMALVSTLLENGMSINKNTLMLFNRLTLQNPNASMADLIKLTKLQLPVNDNSLSQLQHYENMEHKLLDGIREASDEILKLYDALTGTAAGQGSQNGAAQGAALGQTALATGGKFMEQVLVLLTGEEGQTGTAQGSGNINANTNTDAAVSQENQGSKSACPIGRLPLLPDDGLPELILQRRHAGAAVDVLDLYRWGHVFGRVDQHPLDLLILIVGIGFVAGLEIEDFACSPAEHTAGAEDLSALVPADKDQLIRLRNQERLRIHLLLSQIDIGAYALDNGMGRIDRPDPGGGAVLTPAKLPGGSQQPLEGLGDMPGMEHDQTHAAQHPIRHPLGGFIRNLLMMGMTPPEQHVRIVQHLLGQSVLRLVQGGEAHLKGRVLSQSFPDALMEPLGIDGLDRLHLLFMTEFVPDSHTNLFAFHYKSLLSLKIVIRYTAATDSFGTYGRSEDRAQSARPSCGVGTALHAGWSFFLYEKSVLRESD